MHCPSTILVNNNWLWIHLSTDGDFNYKKHIPKTNWLNPFRYEVGVLGEKNGGRPLILNREWKHLRTSSRAIFRIKHYWGCRRGRHQMYFDGKCLACGKPEGVKWHSMADSTPHGSKDDDLYMGEFVKDGKGFIRQFRYLGLYSHTYVTGGVLVK